MLEPQRATTEVEEISLEKEMQWLQTGELIPLGSAFNPVFQELPNWQYSYQITNGKEHKGCRKFTIEEHLIPVEKPSTSEVLVYMLASEMNDYGLNKVAKQPHEHITTGHLGLGLIVAVGEETEREGWVHIGRLVTIDLTKKSALTKNAVSFGSRPTRINSKYGTHQQFVIAHLSQIMPGNHLWEGYWDQRDFSIKIVPAEELNETSMISLNEPNEVDACIIRFALPRLNLKHSSELFQIWNQQE